MLKFNGQEIKEVIKTLFSQEIGIEEECKAKDMHTVKDDRLCVEKKKGKERENMGLVPLKKGYEDIYSMDYDENGEHKNNGIQKRTQQ